MSSSSSTGYVHRPDRLFLAARRMAAHGWWVFPVRPFGKTPAAPAAHSVDDTSDPLAGRCRGQCGRLGHGLHDATRDVEQVREMWLRWPNANVGISCGPSGLVVVDVDTPSGPRPDRVLRDQGDDEEVPVHVTHPINALTWLCDRRGGRRRDLDTLVVATPTGGRHLYFHAPLPAPDGEPVRVTSGAGMTSGLGWGLDVRAWGGYVVAPPSRRPEGDYCSLGGRIQPLPGWLLAALTDAGRTTTPVVAADAVDGEPAAAAARDAVRVCATATTAHLQRHGAPVDDHGRRHRYLTAAVSGELERVWNAPAGELNTTLARSGFALGQLVTGYGLDAGAVADALTDAARHAATRGKPFNETKTAATIARALAAGAARPRTGR